MPCGKRGRCALAPPTALTSPFFCDALLDRLLFLVQDTAIGRVPIA